MNDSKEGAAEIVVAEVIEEDAKQTPASELVISNAQPLSDVEANFAAVKAYVDGQLATYAVMDISDEEAYAQAKRDRTALRKMIAGIDDQRKRVKDIYTAPVTAFDNRVKAIIDPAKTLDAGIKDALDKYDAQWQAHRSASLRKHAEEIAPYLFCPLDGQEEPLMRYGRIEDAKWLGRSFGEVKAQQELETIVGKIAADEKSIEALHLPHEAEAKAEYFATLDFSAAVKRNADLCAQEERARALEQARREAQEAEVRAMEDAEAARAAQTYAPEVEDACAEVGMTPEQVFERPLEPEDDGRVRMAMPEQPETRDVTMRFYAVTAKQVADIKVFCRSNGIHGKVM